MSSEMIFNCDQCQSVLDRNNSATLFVVLHQGPTDQSLEEVIGGNYSWRSTKTAKLHLCKECFGEDCKMDWKDDQIELPKGFSWVKRVLRKLGIVKAGDNGEGT